MMWFLQSCQMFCVWQLYRLCLKRRHDITCHRASSAFLKMSEGTSQVSLLFIVCCSYCSRFKSWIVKILHIILSGFWCCSIQFDSSLCNQSPPPPPFILRHLLQIWFLKRREFMPRYYRFWKKCTFSYFLELLRYGFGTFCNWNSVLCLGIPQIMAILNWSK